VILVELQFILNYLGTDLFYLVGLVRSLLIVQSLVPFTINTILPSLISVRSLLFASSFWFLQSGK
jgi:uncharacterized membrane protein